MRRQVSVPVDPTCPAVMAFIETLWDDPITTEAGVGDEIQADWERKHIAECDRCQEYGAANIEMG